MKTILTCGFSEMVWGPNSSGSINHPLVTAALGLVNMQSPMTTPHPTHFQLSPKTPSGDLTYCLRKYLEILLY